MPDFLYPPRYLVLCEHCTTPEEKSAPQYPARCLLDRCQRCGVTVGELLNIKVCTPLAGSRPST